MPPFVGTELFRRDILEEHFESLEFLWGQRRSFVRGSGMSLRDLVDHDERIAAHADALVLAGVDGVDLVREGLLGDDTWKSLAAAHVLLSTRDAESSRLVTEALILAEPAARAGLGLALCHVPTDMVDTELRRLTTSQNDHLAAIALEALARHGPAPETKSVFARLLEAGDPKVRRAAWRISITWVRPGAASPVDRKTFERGAMDADPEVRALALEAAAWWRQPWLLERCRGDAQSFSPAGTEAAGLLAVLGTAQDLELVRALAAEAALGPSRFEIVGSYGHPALLEPLVAVMEGKDPTAAAAAAIAFTRITDVDVGSGRRVPVRPPGPPPDDFEAEFLDEVEIPDAAVARQAIGPFREKAGDATRLFRGTPVGGNHDQPQLLATSALDLRARCEMALRLGHAGKLPVAPGELDAFPAGM